MVSKSVEECSYVMFSPDQHVDVTVTGMVQRKERFARFESCLHPINGTDRRSGEGVGALRADVGVQVAVHIVSYSDYLV
jgi:hypothetical protein